MDEMTPTPPEAPLNSPSPSRLLVISLLVILALGIIAGGFFLFKKEKIVEVKAPEQIFSPISQEEYLRYRTSSEEGKVSEQCKELQNYFERMRCEEKILLPLTSGITRTDDKCLEITLKSGEKKKICNEYDESGYSVREFIFAKYLPDIGYWLTHSIYNHGHGEVVIDETTGIEMNMHGEPIFSPSGNKFLTYNLDLSEAGYNVNGFQIWDKSGDSWIKVYEYYDLATTTSTPSFGIYNPVWVNENTLYFIKKYPEQPWWDEGPEVPPKPDEYASFSLDQIN